MGYEPFYTDAACEQLDRLPIHIQTRVMDEIDRIAEDPCSAPCLWPVRQLFSFEMEDGNRCHLFNIVWRLNESTNRLYVLTLGNISWPTYSD
jgi:hypothetical protein